MFVVIPLLFIILFAGFIVILIYLIAKRIDDKKKENFEKRDY